MNCLAVFPEASLSARVEGDPVQKYNTAVLRCRTRAAAAAQYSEVVAWVRGNTHLFPSPRGGEWGRASEFKISFLTFEACPTAITDKISIISAKHDDELSENARRALSKPRRRDPAHLAGISKFIAGGRARVAAVTEQMAANAAHGAALGLHRPNFSSLATDQPHIERSVSLCG